MAEGCVRNFHIILRVGISLAFERYFGGVLHDLIPGAGCLRDFGHGDLIICDDLRIISTDTRKRGRRTAVVSSPFPFRFTICMFVDDCRKALVAPAVIILIKVPGLAFQGKLVILPLFVLTSHGKVQREQGRPRRNEVRCTGADRYSACPLNKHDTAARDTLAALVGKGIFIVCQSVFLRLHSAKAVKILVRNERNGNFSGFNNAYLQPNRKLIVSSSQNRVPGKRCTDQH